MEEEDNSDECEVAHERSKGAKTRVRNILFLPCSILYFFSCMHGNGHFFCMKRGKKIPLLRYTRKMPVRRFDRDNFAPIVGFHNDEVGCSYFPVFATNLPFGPLDDEKITVLMQVTQFFLNMRELLIIPTGITDNTRISPVYPKKGIFFPRCRQKK